LYLKLCKDDTSTLIYTLINSIDSDFLGR